MKTKVLPLITAFLLLSFASVSWGAAKQARIVFDQTHQEVFSPVKDGPLNYSAFYASLKKDHQLSASVNSKPIDDKSLSGADIYVLAGPMTPFSSAEGAAIEKFVNNGGSLLVLLHISKTAAPVARSFGVHVTNFVISESTNLVGKESQDFYVSKFSKHPVTDGVKKVAVFGTWGLKGDKGAMVVASTSDKSWADMNRNRAFDSGEPRQSFGIIAVREYGKGKVVVVADDAPFANKFITLADNKKLADNIVKWLKPRP